MIVSSEIILLWDGMEQGRSLPRVNIENQMILTLAFVDALSDVVPLKLNLVGKKLCEVYCMI